MKTIDSDQANTSTKTTGMQRLRGDLRSSLRAFPRECVEHLRRNLDRLEPGNWHDASANTGCVFYLLSEMLPSRITTIHDLAAYFPDDAATCGVSGMPARLVLRAFDGYTHHDSVDKVASERYEGTVLDTALLRRELDFVIRQDRAAEEPSPALETWSLGDFGLAIG